MSHIYQPVMLLELLRRGGSASTKQIAHALLSHDESQLEYYEQITRNMVGKVLTKNRGITSREGDRYNLNAFDALSSEEVKALIGFCKDKLDSYIEKRGKRIWEHRTKSAGYISGTLRYEVLKRAKFRCELCGILDKDKALEVDHIVPRNHGGTDDIHNLQSLCFSCNAMKRDRDNTDFRGIAESYSHRAEGCIFCEIPNERIVAENALCFAIRDAYPVTEGHTLIIPKRHVADYFDLYQPELNAISALLIHLRSELCRADHLITGFNTGANSGYDAGQTVFHCHIHLIPRRKNDVENPRGGVRGVIAAKQKY